MELLKYLLHTLVLFLFISSPIIAEDKKKGDVNAYLKRTGSKFLEEVAKREGILKLKSGLLVEIIHQTTNENARSPTKFDSCEVSYKGTLKDGTVFDQGTTSFSPAQVIKGWTEAMQLMAEGDKYKLYIPYDLAYGERGSPPKIPGFSPLVFELEIHKVKSTKGKSLAEARKLLEESLVKEEL